MNRYYIRFLLQRDLKLYQHPVLIVLIVLPVVQLCSFSSRLYEAYQQILRHYPVGTIGTLTERRPDPSLTATALPSLMNESGLLTSGLIAALLLMALTVPIFLSDTKDGKNIATQMRLPISRLHYYGVRMLLPTAAMALFWLIELFVSLAFWGMYHLTIPDVCMPAGADAACWTSELCLAWFPIAAPARIPAALCGIVLFPAATVLCALANRGQDILCLAGEAVAVIGCVLFLIPGWVSSLFIPLITVGIILFSGWAISHRKTF